MALMTDNIAVLKEEVELAKKIFPETWKGLDTNVYGKNKKTFSTNALTSAKSNPACYIKKITKSLHLKEQTCNTYFNTKIFIAQRCNFLPFLPTNLWNLALCFGSKLYRNYWKK